jgi:hypothetical protein
LGNEPHQNYNGQEILDLSPVDGTLAGDSSAHCPATLDRPYYMHGWLLADGSNQGGLPSIPPGFTPSWTVPERSGILDSNSYFQALSNLAGLDDFSHNTHYHLDPSSIDVDETTIVSTTDIESFGQDMDHPHFSFESGQSMLSGSFHPLDHLKVNDEVSPGNIAGTAMPSVERDNDFIIDPRPLELATIPIWKIRRSSEPEQPASKKRILALRPTPERTDYPNCVLSPAPCPNVPQSPRRYTFATDSISLFRRPNPDLTFIQEIPPNSGTGNKGKDMKGRRKGPLSAETREQAKKSRKQKLVCIRCKKDRQAVSTGATDIQMQVLT